MGLGWLRAVAQGYNYNYSKIELGSNFPRDSMSLGIKSNRSVDGCARWRLPAQGPWHGAKSFKEWLNKLNAFYNKIELGLAWLRAVAQGYNYIYNKIELGSNFQRDVMSWGIKLGWGLDG